MSSGREWDGDAGLYYNRARWMDANTGRFLSEDPLGFAAGDSNLCDSPPLSESGGLSHTVVSIDARAIQFSQSNVRHTLPRITQSMRANGWQGAPIDVVRMSDGTLIAVDNTRLAAAKLTGTPVQATIRSFYEPFPAIRDLDNIYFSNPVTGGRAATWGEAVFSRMNGQNPIWIEQYPLGSPFTGVNSGSGSVLP